MSEISVGSVKITGFDKKTWYNPGDWFGQHDEKYREIYTTLAKLLEFGIKVKIGDKTFESTPSAEKKIKQNEIKETLKKAGATKEEIEEAMVLMEYLLLSDDISLSDSYDLGKIRSALKGKTIDFGKLVGVRRKIERADGETDYDILVKALCSEEMDVLEESAIVKDQAAPQQNRYEELEQIMRREIDFDQDARPLAEQQTETRHAVEEYETLGEDTVDDIRIAQLRKVLSDDSANFYAKQTALFELRKFSGDERVRVKGILLRFIEENADAEGTFLNDSEKSWLVRTAIGSLRIIDSAHWDKLTAEEVHGLIEPIVVFYHYLENKLISKLKELVKDAKIHGKDIKGNGEGRSPREWNEDGLKSALADGAKFVKIS